MQMRSEPNNQDSVISFVLSKWLLPELSIPAAGQKDRGLWAREWFRRGILRSLFFLGGGGGGAYLKGALVTNFEPKEDANSKRGAYLKLGANSSIYGI